MANASSDLQQPLSERADALDVFLSYSRDDDEQFVAYLRDYLVERGINVWRDRESMRSDGTPWSAQAVDVVRQATRLALIVGPGALQSTQVMGEWQAALHEGLAVTPLIRGPYPADESVTFAQLVEALPRRLRRLHAVDCRTHRPEREVLEEVARLLAQKLGALGEVYNEGPPLPSWYVWRNDLLEDLINAICTSDAIGLAGTASGTTGVGRPVAVQGMAGAGKTLLARAVVRDGGVRRLFPDGIFWISIGKTPSIALRQAEIGKQFGAGAEEFTDERRGQQCLAKLLKDKAALLVLDDVWEVGHAQAFQVDAPSCRLLITTRWGQVARRLDAINHRPDVLTEDEALELLTGRLRSSGQARQSTSEEQRRLVRVLGYHAQAIGLAAAWLQSHGETQSASSGQTGHRDRTAEYLERLDNQREQGSVFDDLNIERDDRNLNLEQSLAQSYDSLGETGQRRFRALGAFAEGTPFERAALAAVWGQTELSAETGLNELVQAALIERLDMLEYRQHMLLRLYAHALLRSDAAEHTEVRERHYRYSLERLRAGGANEAHIAQALYALEGSATKLPLIEALIPHLMSSPFVWSGVQRALVLALGDIERPSASSEGEEVWSVVERLVDSPEAPANRLVVSALGAHCRELPAGQAAQRLDGWLQSTTTGVRPRSAAQIAVLARHERLLKLALTHASEPVRNIVVNDAHLLWKGDPELVRRLLTFLTGHITFRQLPHFKKLTPVITTAVNLSILVVARDYADRGLAAADVGQIETDKGESLAMVRAAWRPVIRECLMVNRAFLLGPLARQVRRALLGLIARITVSKIDAIDKREYFTFSFEDVKQFFPATEEHRHIVDSLIDYIGPQDDRSLQDLTNYIYQLAVRGLADESLNSWLITSAAHLALLAHMHRTPSATADAIYALLERIEQLYPATEDMSRPTGRLWYLVLTFPYLSFPFSDTPEGRKALRQFMDVSLVAELRFRNTWLCSSGRKIRVSNLEQYLFGYKLGVDELGRDVLIQTLLFDLEKDDRSHIAWTPYSIAVGMKRYHAAAEGIQALDDLISLLHREKYFDRLSDEDLRGFWEKAADDLMQYAGEYQSAILAFIRRWRQQKLAPRLDRALQAADNRMTVRVRTHDAADDAADLEIGEAIAWCVRNTLYDRDPTLRELLRWFFHELARTDTPESAMSALMQRVINAIYGESIF